MDSMWILLSYVANNESELHQLDVKNAFQHDDLEAGAYIDIPHGFTYEKTTGKVCNWERFVWIITIFDSLVLQIQ